MLLHLTWLLCALAPCIAVAQSVFSLSPSRPVTGSTVTLRYIPEVSFRPAPGESVVVEVLAAGPSVRVYDVTLNRTADLFMGTWSIPADAEALVFRVAVGDRVDDRRGAGWADVVYSNDGEALPGSIRWLAQAHEPNGLHGFRARNTGKTADGVPSLRKTASEEDRDWRSAVAHRAPDDRWRALIAFSRKHGQPTDDASVQVIIRSALAAHAWDAADELIHRQARKEPLWLISLAQGLMNANANLDRASVLAKESVNAARNWDPALKSSLLSLREYRNQRASEVPLALRTYGRSLVMLGYPASAEKVYAEAIQLLDGKDPDVENEYETLLRSLGKSEKIREMEETSRR